ncbi:MAG: YlxR family protein [Fimbriimonadaceae bacterium]|nr:YlxR family protein [Fimbriimonadaceae bacterium]
MPIRTCVGCRGKFEQATLFRIVKGEDATIRLAEQGSHFGRSAYVCKSMSCVEAALRKDALARTLKSLVTAQAKEELEEILICKLR